MSAAFKLAGDEKPHDPLSVVERKYSWPYWIFMREFRDDTGFGASRIADALAVGLYASRGQIVIGFEQKVSRSDWLSELKKPEKAEAIAKFCDYWNVVVPDAGIVQLEELPPNWGLLVAAGRRVKTIKAAVQLSPIPISRYFLSALVKRAVDDAILPYQKTKAEARQAELDEMFERGKNSADYELKMLRDLQKEVLAFEKASGLKILSYGGGTEMGEAVEAIRNRRHIIRRMLQEGKSAAKEMADAAQTLLQNTKRLEAALRDDKQMELPR